MQVFLPALLSNEYGPPGPAEYLLVIPSVPFCSVAIMSTHSKVRSASMGKKYPYLYLYPQGGIGVDGL